MRNRIDSNQLIGAISADKYKTAVQIRNELGLKISPRKVSRILRGLRKQRDDIETVMKGQSLLYRKKGKTTDTPVKDVQSKAPVLKEASKELTALMQELGSQGVNVQEVCVNALLEKKNSTNSHFAIVEKEFPEFAKDYKKLQDEVKRMRNLLGDCEVKDGVEKERG